MPREEGGDIPKEKQEEFEKDRKRAIEEMLGNSYIPHRKSNERISVKEFSQEGEKEMVVFDEIRLDQGPIPRLIEKRLSVKDFYNTYVTHLKKARLDESHRERSDEKTMKKEKTEKELEDALLQSEIIRLKEEEKALGKRKINSFEDMGENMKAMSHIKDEIEKLQKQREVVIGKSVGTRAEFEKKVKQLDVITQEITDLKSRNVKGEGSAEKGSVESTTEKGVTSKESIERSIKEMESLDELIVFVKSNKDDIRQHFGEVDSLVEQRLNHIKNILKNDSLSTQDKMTEYGKELSKFSNINAIRNRIHEIVQDILVEKKKKSSKSDEKVDIQGLENDEKVEKISEFERVRKEIQGAQSFEEVYAILEKYKDNITGDIGDDTERSYGDIVEQIKNAHESFVSHIHGGSLTEEEMEGNRDIVNKTLPKRFSFKKKEISIRYETWKRCISTLIEEEQDKAIDQEPLEGKDISLDIREEVGESMSQEGQKSPEESAFEQEIQNAKSLEDLIERITAYQGDIFDGESASSKEDIIRVLTALSVSVLTQEPNAPRPSENDQYQSDFFSKIPEAHDLQERAKQLTDKEWEEKYPDAGKNPKEEEEERGEEGENPNADKGDGGVEGKEEKKDEGKQDTETQGDYEGIKPGFNLVPVSSTKEILAEERKDEEGDFLRELTKELDDARRDYAQNIYNGEKKKRYNDVLVRYNTEVSSRFGDFIGEREFEQMVRANEIQEQLAIKDIRAEHLIEKAPLWEKGKSFLKDRVKQWKDLSLKQKVLVSASIVGVGGAGILTGSAVLGAGALVAGTAVRAVSFAATSSGFKGILELYSKKLYEGAERERIEQARSLFRENEYGSDSPEQRGDNITRLLAQSAEKQASRARKRRLERHARTAAALAGALTLVMASRCLGQTAVDALGGYFGGPLEGSGGVTEPQGKIEIGIEKEPIAYDKDYIFPDKPPQEYVPEIKTIEVPIERTPEEYIQAHPEMFREISERKWMDNNTSLQVGANGRITGADLNELNLRWGGGGDGIDADGNYVFDVAKMTPDGSFHKDLSVDARDAIQKGQLKMLFTLDGDTQSYGIEIPVRPDGSVVIDPQSPEGKLLFQTVGEGTDTKLEFKGKFAEVGVIGEDGKFTVLATHTGEGLESMPDVIKKEIIVPQIDQEIPPVEQGAEPVGGGGETTIISEDAIVEDKQQEITSPLITGTTVLEEPVVPLGKEPSLERVIVGPGEVAVLGLAGMGARKIHKARGEVNQSMIPAPVRRPEVTPSSAPLELEGKKDGEKIIASLREYKEYEKGLSLEEKKKINDTVKKFEELANKTEEELKAMTAQGFGGLLIGMKIKNRTSSFVTAKVGGENEDIQTLIREEMTNPKEAESAYEYIRRSIIQSMVLTREYK